MKNSKLIALYDQQCEICQAMSSWLKLLDGHQRVDIRPIEAAELTSFHTSLKLEECLQTLHVVTPDGQVLQGWDAVARLARVSDWTAWIGFFGSIPPFSWLGHLIYNSVARNRYTLSKCRGGACHAVAEHASKRRTSFSVFWSCYSLGMLLRFPLIVGLSVKERLENVRLYLRTFRKRFDLIEGKLSLCFLGGILPDLVPLTFGERFVMVLYKGVAFDPGSVCMRGSLRRHLGRLPAGSVRAIVATHRHEEHVGNLEWLSARTGTPVQLGPLTLRHLQPADRIPFIRRLIIGQPHSIQGPVEPLGERLSLPGLELYVYPAPGHCDDHILFYDPAEKLLITGDAFMGTYFSSPNPDVDSVSWMATLEHLLTLDIEIMVEGHGHIRTLRPDIADLPGIVIRSSPKEALQEKLAFFKWLRAQIQAGMVEGLPPLAIEASCFPWGRSWAWENFLMDEVSRWISGGEFSRSELVRSFTRAPESRAVLPDAYQVQFYQSKGGR